MDKKRLFRIMANMNRKKLEELSKMVRKNGEVIIVKEPVKTLTMIKMREPVKNSMFYIGEVMVTETIVEMNGIKGMAVTMGDDFDKTLNMAIIDCGFNNGFSTMEKIQNELIIQEAKQTKRKEKENAMHLKTMVNFNTMSGGEA